MGRVLVYDQLLVAVHFRDLNDAAVGYKPRYTAYMTYMPLELGVAIAPLSRFGLTDKTKVTPALIKDIVTKIPRLNISASELYDARTFRQKMRRKSNNLFNKTGLHFKVIAGGRSDEATASVRMRVPVGQSIAQAANRSGWEQRQFIGDSPVLYTEFPLKGRKGHRLDRAAFRAKFGYQLLDKRDLYSLRRDTESMRPLLKGGYMVPIGIIYALYAPNKKRSVEASPTGDQLARGEYGIKYNRRLSMLVNTIYGSGSLEFIAVGRNTSGKYIPVAEIRGWSEQEAVLRWSSLLKELQKTSTDSEHEELINALAINNIWAGSSFRLIPKKIMDDYIHQLNLKEAIMTLRKNRLDELASEPPPEYQQKKGSGFSTADTAINAAFLYGMFRNKPSGKSDYKSAPFATSNKRVKKSVVAKQRALAAGRYNPESEMGKRAGKFFDKKKFAGDDKSVAKAVGEFERAKVGKSKTGRAVAKHGGTVGKKTVSGAAKVQQALHQSAARVVLSGENVAAKAAGKNVAVRAGASTARGLSKVAAMGLRKAPIIGGALTAYAGVRSFGNKKKQAYADRMKRFNRAI
jgi:hypothetical protein